MTKSNKTIAKDGPAKSSIPERCPKKNRLIEPDRGIIKLEATLAIDSPTNRLKKSS